MDIFSDTTFRDLEKLNFSVNESKVYLVLIKIGSSLAGRISKEANLDRSSTYNALKMLVEKGIVSTVHENKRTIFVPANPKKIVDYFKEKQELANKIVPFLKERYSLKKEKKNITLFQGYKGLKTIFQDILSSCNKNEEYLIIASEGQFGEKMPYYAPLFRKLKLEKKIKTKMLIREGRNKKTKSPHTQYKVLPSDVISPATINIYNGKVAIFIWEEKPEAILIKNKEVSETFKNYFNFVWKHAKKLD
jgi:sugar-specific transcriptional regulator TrmB|tara:strand:+ start:1065 stop:1808 length:744 start_codon:yes stop_codon:yes gene_type:complete